MKYLPTYLLLILLPFFSSAQSFSIGINAGAAVTGRKGDNAQYVSQKMKTGPAGSLRITADIKGWQGGIAIEAGNIHNQISVDVPVIYFNNIPYMGYQLKYTEVLAPVYASTLLFINKKIKLRGSFLYAGIAGGGMYILGSENTFAGTAGENTMKYGSTIGLVYGLQAGYTLPVTKKLGINAEAAYRRAKVTHDMPGYSADDYISGEYKLEHTLIYIPLTFGVRYQL
jgi:hypothetical protein